MVLSWCLDGGEGGNDSTINNNTYLTLATLPMPAPPGTSGEKLKRYDWVVGRGALGVSSSFASTPKGVMLISIKGRRRLLNFLCSLPFRHSHLLTFTLAFTVTFHGAPLAFNPGFPNSLLDEPSEYLEYLALHCSNGHLEKHRTACPEGSLPITPVDKCMAPT